MRSPPEHIALTPQAWRSEAQDPPQCGPSTAYAFLTSARASQAHNGTNSHSEAATPPVKPVEAIASKILFLDGLRGLAAMLVVAQHSFFMIRHPVGQPAVDMFFVLSAFLLTMIFEKKARTLVREKASYRRWGWALLDYFVRRFLRVYPLFVVVVFVLLLLPDDKRKAYFVVFEPEQYNVLRTLVFQFDYRYHVFWTLPLEIMYYLIIPVFVVVTIVLKRWWWVPMLPLAYLVLYSGFYWFRTDHQGLKPHLPTFLCGSMAAIVYSKAAKWIQTRRFVFNWSSWVLLRSIEMVLLAILFSVVFEGLFFRWVAPNPVTQAPGGHFVAANVSVIIVCELLLPGTVASVLEWSLLRFAGKVSYSMYLLHSFVVFSPWVNRQVDDDWFFAIWGLVFLLSATSYYTVEYPCQLLASYVGEQIKKLDTIEKQRTAATERAAEELHT